MQATMRVRNSASVLSGLRNDVERTTPATPRGVRKAGRAVVVPLWIVQALLALLFLFAGVMKLVAPPEMLAGGPVALPLAFLRFIGVCETLGALGLILPGLSGIRTGLTPLAAAGLVIIMIGATVLTAVGGDVTPALFPLVVGLLCAAVAYGRSRLAPHRTSWRRAA